MEEKKKSMISLLKVLEEYTDSDHLLTQPQLKEKLENLYGITIDRRTLYSHIEKLKDLGYEIEDYSDNNKGYCLSERLFEPYQIFLLANAVHSCNVIPSKSSKELIEKLLTTQNHYVRQDYRNMVYVDNPYKADNKEFFLSIEELCKAIKEKKSIKFNYLKYNLNGKLENRRDNPYHLTPYYVVYMQDRVYLVGKSPNHNGFTHFRVDKMKNVKTTDEPYIHLAANEDPYQYAKTKINMYSGETKNIAIRCDMSILDNVIDTFGADTHFTDNKDNTFTAYVKSSGEGMVFFALQYIKHMEILSPEDLREDVKQALKEGVEKYK